jgi:hypothetical protein
MRETSPRGWYRWRVTVVRYTPPAAFDRMTRLALPSAPDTRPVSEEIPAPDGVRHELVARIRQEIAAGTYDTEEKWLLAEEALLRRIGD